MLDYGLAALVETLELLDAAGIKRGRREKLRGSQPSVADQLQWPPDRLPFYAFIYSANTRMAAGIGKAWRTIAWAEFCRRFGRSNGPATMSSS